MTAPPVIVTIRPGVAFAPPAAASWTRMEADAGRRIDCNSSYREWDKQLAMWAAWNAYVGGSGPRPPHGRAIHPEKSMHCQGLAADTDDVTLLLRLSDHGWRRTAPDEAWHFEYQAWHDQHKNRPATGGDAKPIDPNEPKEWDEMATKAEIQAAFKEVVGDLVKSASAVRVFEVIRGDGTVQAFIGAPGQRAVHITNPTDRDVLERYIGGGRGGSRDRFNSAELEILNRYLPLLDDDEASTA